MPLRFWKYSPTPPLPHMACLALWAALGPLGAGAAASGRWTRALLEGGMTLLAMNIFSEGLGLIRMGPRGALAQALATGAIDAWRLWAFVVLLCFSVALWLGDLWRMRSWHGKPADPLLDPKS